MLGRFKDDSFNEKYISTIGIDSCRIEHCEKDSKKIFIIYDTSGHQRFRCLNKNYLRNSDIIFLVYDVTNCKSFNDLNDWLTMIYDKIEQENNIRILIGNKCDLDDKRIISFRQGSEFAASNGFEYIETSAKENININAILKIINDKIDRNKQNKKI